MMHVTGGRLVWNHSTHVPGLIPILKRLIRRPGIRTVTPAVIKTVRSNAQTFRLKVSVPTQAGFKLIARKGKTAQEVFVVTALSQQELEDAIAHSIKK